MTSQQEVIHDSEPSALESTETGSVEPADLTAPIDVYQVTVEPHVQGDDAYKATSGGEVIPRSPIRKPFRVALAVFSGWMILCGREQLLLLIFRMTWFQAVCKVEYPVFLTLTLTRTLNLTSVRVGQRSGQFSSLFFTPSIYSLTPKNNNCSPNLSHY